MGSVPQTRSDGVGDPRDTTPNPKRPRIKGSALYLLRFLARLHRASESRGIPFAFPSHQRIADELGFVGADLRQVRHLLRRLRDAGLIWIGKPSRDPDLADLIDRLQADGKPITRPHGGWNDVYRVLVDPARLDELGYTGRRAAEATPRANSRKRRRRRQAAPARADQPTLFGRAGEQPQDGEHDRRDCAGGDRRDCAGGDRRDCAGGDRRDCAGGCAPAPLEAIEESDRPEQEGSAPPTPQRGEQGDHARSGAGGDAPEEPDQLSPALDLARRFSGKSTKERGSSGELYYPPDGRACRREAEELLRHVRYELIVAEIDREQRDKSEWFRDLARRLMQSHGATTATQRGGQTNGHQRHAGTRYRYDPARDG